MEDSSREAVASFRRWSDAFNARDTEAQLAEMHFPHLRLAGNRFQWWETADDFSAVQEEVTRRLARARMIWRLILNAIKRLPSEVI